MLILRPPSNNKQTTNKKKKSMFRYRVQQNLLSKVVFFSLASTFSHSVRPCSTSSSGQANDPEYLNELTASFATTSFQDMNFFASPHGVETILDVLAASNSPEALCSAGDAIVYICQ